MVNGPSGTITIDEAIAIAGVASNTIRIKLVRRCKFILESLPRERTPIQHLLKKGLISRPLKDEKQEGDYLDFGDFGFKRRGSILAARVSVPQLACSGSPPPARRGNLLTVDGKR
jgi:hypothetical protein